MSARADYFKTTAVRRFRWPSKRGWRGQKWTGNYEWQRSGESPEFTVAQPSRSCAKRPAKRARPDNLFLFCFVSFCLFFARVRECSSRATNKRRPCRAAEESGRGHGFSRSSQQRKRPASTSMTRLFPATCDRAATIAAKRA